MIRLPFFSCMIDYYALDNEFPGFDEAQSIIDVHNRVLFLEEALAQDINRPKFIPYIQLHEFEALILTDLDKIRNYFLDVPSINRHISELKKEISSFSNPEEINSGSNTAPSKRLIQHIPRYDKVKATAGPFIATEIGHNLLRNKCPHFGYWLDKIENLKDLE